MARILLACIGNPLRGDDGFGPAVMHAVLEEGGVPAGVRTADVGIGGMSLVHELLAGYDALLIVDAVDRGSEPGTLHVLHPDVPEIDAMSPAERHALSGDMHEMVPSRALVLARALDALPPIVRIVGCQPHETEEFELGLTPAVRRAIPRALRIVRALLAGLTAAAAAGMIALAPDRPSQPGDGGSSPGRPHGEHRVG